MKMGLSKDICSTPRLICHASPIAEADNSGFFFSDNLHHFKTERNLPYVDFISNLKYISIITQT